MPRKPKPITREQRAVQALTRLIQAVVDDPIRRYYGTAENPGGYVDQNLNAAYQEVLAMMVEAPQEELK